MRCEDPARKGGIFFDCKIIAALEPSITLASASQSGERAENVDVARSDSEIEQVPLCVDLDGTLIKSDTLMDSLLVMARKRPALLRKLPSQLYRGKAALKAFVAESVSLEVKYLPYNRKLVQFLQQERTQGRAIYLTTGADQRLAQRVAAHLGIFSGVLGSDGTTNLTGKEKLVRLRSHLGSDRFSYIGNSRADLPLLAHATEPMVANPSLWLQRGLQARGIRPVQEFVERRSLAGALLSATRLHQWAKNLLVFAPILLAHRLNFKAFPTVLLAFFCFCFTASATYVVNDMLDIEADRRHSRKRYRPFASGDLGPLAGPCIVAVFLLPVLLSWPWLPIAFHGWLILYLLVTLAYSFYFKRVALVDVLVLAGLYTIRLFAGGAATNITISHWLAGFSIFLFLSLAFVKRFSELENLRSSNTPPRNGRGYLVADIEQMRAFGTASAFATVVVFANYISGRDVTRLYRQPNLLWLIMPLMILWLCRVWLLASRGKLSEDPVLFAVTDKASLLIGAIVATIAILASFSY
jgi:4-hydroxybenzoate polyprenyltransferase/phosphoserine phosphatase